MKRRRKNPMNSRYTPEQAAVHMVQVRSGDVQDAIEWAQLHEGANIMDGDRQAATYWAKVGEALQAIKARGRASNPVKVFQVAEIRDYRVGVSLSLMGVVSTRPTEWVINYIGQYGWPGDPGSHHDVFGLNNFEGAMIRWKKLVYDYHARVLGVNRLKATKKIWVPPVSKRHVKTDEAYISHRDLVTAAMISRGPRTRRKRRWEMAVDWANPAIDPRRVEKMLIPAPAPANFIPRPGVEVVPLNKMSERLNELWGATIKLYRAEMGDVKV